MKRITLFLLASALLILVLSTAFYFLPKTSTFNYVLDAVVLDADGNEIGIQQIHIQGSRINYVTKDDHMDITIDPFADYSVIRTDTDNKTGIKGLIKQGLTGEYYRVAISGGCAESGTIFFGYLGFDADLEKWIFSDQTNEIYYIASVTQNSTTHELAKYFRGLTPHSWFGPNAA